MSSEEKERWAFFAERHEMNKDQKSGLRYL